MTTAHPQTRRVQGHHARAAEPVGVRSVELTQPLRDLADVTAFARVRVYAMRDDVPLGYVEIANAYGPIDAAGLRAALEREPQLLAAPAPPAEALPAQVPVSVIVATLDRPEGLRDCLRLLLAQRSPRRIEIVVVDNHPASGRTAPVVAEFPGVVLVSEPRRGLAYARNAGFAAASGQILLTTDDDVTVPAGWVERLVAPFADARVMATTGNVLPAQLATPAQQLFEVYGGLGRGFERRVADPAWFRGFRSAVPTWRLGATANAAFRASALADVRVGLMDEALGPGMPSGVGEDTYLFYRILRAGHTLVYEPAAYVWHTHRATMPQLRRQLLAYSTGHVAYHLTTLLRDGDRRALRQLLMELPRAYAWRAREALRARPSYPLSLLALELAGSLAGPWALWRSRRRVRQEGRSAPMMKGGPA
ncbi:MAG TPA: glycosyltransferase [Chloroflexaceae bacterium]|nr:glycosyltransferase [Chloroflexaceae bacterium]